MSTGAASTVADSPGELRLQHWIYGSAPDVGYSVRAQSADLNLSFYARRLDGIYTPLGGESLHADDSTVDVLMVHPVSSGTELLFSLIGPGPVEEEYRRRTFVNHTAVIPVEALLSGRLAFAEVDRAIRAFDASSSAPTGRLDPLAAHLNDPGAPAGGSSPGISRFLTFASAETLLSRNLAEPEGRTLILCRDTSPTIRRQTLVSLLEVLNIACGLPFVSALSDTPAGPVASRFQWAVGARAFRTDSSWALLENSLDAPTLPRVPDELSRYDSLGRCFARGSGPTSVPP